MADRYWVGGTANWDGTAGSKWATTSGGAGGAAVPSNTDNVFFDAASGAVTVTKSGSSNCLNLDCTGFTGTLAGTGAISVYGNLTLVAGMTFSHTGAWNFEATTTGKTLTLGGKSLTSADFNGTGGGYTFQDAWLSGVLTHVRGTINTNNQTVQTSRYVSSNSNTRALTLGSTVWTLTSSAGSNDVWDLGTSTNMTLSAGTSSLVFTNPTGAFRTLDGGGLTYYDVTMTGAGSSRVEGTNTFHNFTRTGTAVQTDSVTFVSDMTINGTLTITGNSATNRVWLRNTTRHSARTLTCAAVAITNTDVEDIVIAGAASPVTLTGACGDCGGNSNITFPSPKTCYWIHSATASLNTDAARWATSSGGTAGTSDPPLPQDTARFDASSFPATGKTVVNTFPRSGHINFTGATNSPTFNLGSASTDYFGSITLISGMAFTGTNNAREFAGRGSNTLTSAGKNFNFGSTDLTFNLGAGTLTLQDAFVKGDGAGAGGVTILAGGTLDANDQNVTISTFSATGGTLYMGNGTWQIEESSGASWTVAAGAIINAEGSTIYLSNTGASNKTFSGGSKTYNDVEFAGAASNGIWTLSGSNTFNELKLNPDTKLRITAGTTQTVTTFVATGTSGHVITIDTQTAASAATISCASGIVACDYLSLKDSTATGGATFYAGSNSTNVSGNTGWSFTDPPAPSVYDEDLDFDVTAAYTQSALASFAPTVSAAVVAAFTEAAAVTYTTTTDQGVATSDSNAAQAEFDTSVSEAVTASDTATGGLLLVEGIEEAIGCNDTLAAAVTFEDELHAAVTAADAWSAAAAFVATIDATVDAADGMAAFATFIAAFTASVDAEYTGEVLALFQSFDRLQAIYKTSASISGVYVPVVTLQGDLA